jgi:hypothetical protein
LQPWLFEESYQSVGDLAETISLVLPETCSSEAGLAEWIEDKLLPLRVNPGVSRPPTAALWSQLDRPSLMLCIKLITGSFRVGVSKLLVTRALASMAGLDSKRGAATRGLHRPVEPAERGQLPETDRLNPPTNTLSVAVSPTCFSSPMPCRNRWRSSFCWARRATGGGMVDGIRAQVVKREGRRGSGRAVKNR